ncbi:MAG: phosphatidylglycerophosphatase A [Desulfobacterales bacterium]|nr:phosphatidylglycerophosphatase A [Desulfobacterales bacterium]MBF0397131.1 phosphatidylglycerophosphatase A [Desulfobacterales bacterium]
MISEKMVIFFATGGYTGYIRYMPGTFGSLIGIPFGFLLSFVKFNIIILILFIGLAIWISGQAEKIINTKDPGCIVIDEICGMMVTLLYNHVTIISMLLGFFLFRFFDILKPFPIRLIDKKIKGGAGIVMDDILAGVFANLILRLVLKYV